MTDKNLIVMEQREVVFYGDQITAVLIKQGSEKTVYIPIRPICDLLGIDWSAQYRRVNRDPVLSKNMQGVAVTTTPSADGRGGGRQEMLCIPLDYLNGWLFGINANRVRDEIRDRLIRYQEECYRVLANAFKEGQLTVDDRYADLLQGDSPTAQAYRMAQAIMNMARTQLILESRIDEHEQRLETIESQMGDPDRTIMPAQASAISQAVKAIALELGKRSGRNEFGGVYGELYRRFAITAYRELPVGRYDEAMGFLRQWYQSIADESGIPF
jgi:hypothetical protein